MSSKFFSIVISTERPCRISSELGPAAVEAYLYRTAQ
jgi:hypothetical protein